MRRKTLSLATVCVALMMVLWPSNVSAHAVLDSSSPAPSTVLEKSPTEISLDFSETIESSLLSIRVFDSDQRQVNIGDASRADSDQSIATAQVPKLANGVYVVVWRAVSADGHPVSGAFPFEVGNSSSVDANELLTRVLKGLNTDSPLGTPLAIARFLAYISLVVLIGMFVFAWATPRFSPPVVLTTLRRAVGVFALGSLGIVLMQGPYAAGRGWSALTDGGLLVDVLPTRLGLASLARVFLAVGWGALVATSARASHRWWKAGFAVTALMSVITFSVSGHPSAASLPAVFVVVDSAHFTAVSVWVGAFLAAVLVKTEEGVARLSRLATVAMPIAVLTGGAQALHLTGGISNIFNSRYGTYLLVKVLIIVACLAIGFRVRMNMKKGAPTVNKMLSLEAVLLAVVIAVTAFMVGTSPSATATSATSFSSTQIQGDVVADFSVLPVRVGASEVHVYLTPPGGSISPVDNVEMSFTLPSRGIPAIPVSLIEIGPNHWSGVMQFPYEGEWTLESRVNPTQSSTLLYTATVTITD